MRLQDQGDEGRGFKMPQMRLEPQVHAFIAFLDYTDTFTLLFTYYSNDDNWDLGDKGRGLRMVSSPRYVFFFSIFF